MLTDSTGYFAVSLLIVGAIVGFGVGFGTSVVMQAAIDGEVNWSQALLDGSIGAISGALGASGIGAIGMAISGGLLGFGGSVGGDLIQNNGDFSQVQWGKAVFMAATGAFLGRLSGPGAQNTSNMTSKINSGNSWLCKSFLNLGDSVSDRGATQLARNLSALAMRKAITGYQLQAVTYTLIATGGAIYISEMYGKGVHLYD